MIYTLTNSGLTNGRPTQIGANTISIANRISHVFTIANFTTETVPVYEDPEDDAMSYVKILTLPNNGGSIELNGVAMVAGDLATVGEISTGNLIYIYDDIDTQYSDVFTFDVADVGSNSLSGEATGIFTMEVASKENLPPDSVGNNTIPLNYGDSYTFTAADFTSNTTPAYNDPEGDAAGLLKILDLPVDGNLWFNGSLVIANQEVSFTEITAGYLIYIPDAGITTTQSLEFNFSIADEGSGIFVQSV